MPLPSNFNPWEHLQGVIRQLHNRQLREYFRDLNVDEESILPPRASLKLACEIRDNDTATMVLIRLFFYYFILRQCQDLFPYYGTPIYDLQAQRKFRPQIMLFFEEDRQDVEPGYGPVTGEISFRLMDESSSSLTETKLRSLAQKIRSEFGAGSGYIWRKGREIATYTDIERGYGLKLLMRSQTEGRELIGKVLDIQNHTPDWSLSNLNQNQEPAEAFPIVPPLALILGEQRRMPRRRPIADVRYQYALCHVHGLPNPVALHDQTYRFKNPLVEA